MYGSEKVKTKYGQNKTRIVPELVLLPPVYAQKWKYVFGSPTIILVYFLCIVFIFIL